MKLSRLILTVTMIFIFAACAKDEMLDQSNNLKLKKAKVAIPFKGDFSAVPDMESSLWLLPIPGLDPEDPASYLHTRMIVSGNCTHLGNIDSEKSFYVFETYELIFEGEEPFLSLTGSGHLVGANGDSVDLTWWSKGSLLTIDYFGEMEITGGTGKFEGCSGSTDMKGIMDDKTNTWTLEGTMEFN